MTVYEKIKSMSLDDMADFLKDFSAEDTAEKQLHYCTEHCPLKESCDLDLMLPDECYDIDYKHAIEFWLNQEYEESANE